MNTQDTHQQILERLSDYIERELPDDEIVAVERHLGECESCRHEYKVFDEMLRRLSSMNPAQAPRDLPKQVRKRIRALSRGRFFMDFFFYRFRVPYEVFASMMLAVIGALYLYISPSDLQNLRGEPEVEIADHVGHDTESFGKNGTTPIKSETLGGDKVGPHPITAPTQIVEYRITVILSSNDPESLKRSLYELYNHPERGSQISESDEGLEITMSKAERKNFLNTYKDLVAAPIQREKILLEQAGDPVPLQVQIVIEE